MSSRSPKSSMLVYTILSIILSIPIHAENTPNGLGTLAPGKKMHFTIGNDVPLQIKTADEAKKILQEQIQGDAKATATAFARRDR